MNGQLGVIRSWTGNEIRDRLRTMFRMVKKSIRSPLTRTLAVQMIREAGVPGQNQVPWPKIEIDKAEISAIYDAVKRHGRYTGDIRGLDTYQTLPRSLALGWSPSPILAALVPALRAQTRQVLAQDLVAAFGSGAAEFIFDCDDGTIILDGLLASIGYRVGGKCYSANNGRTFEHVVAVTEIPRYAAGPKYIVPLDVTEYDAYPGSEPPGMTGMIFWADLGG